MQAKISEDADTDNFGKNTSGYHKNAVVQKKVAGRLIKSLEPWKDILPPGPIIELGCGTGFLSEELLQLLPDRDCIITDASVNMIQACEQHLGNDKHVRFEKLDAESIPVDEATYAMTISSFVAQWFRDPAYTLGQWLEVTKPGGLLLAAFPGSESFPEWRKHAKTLGVPFTANLLPDTEEMVIKLSSGQTQVDYYEDTITQKFNSSGDFFRHIKQIGAGKQLNGRHLSSNEMKLLINYWNEQEEGDITVSWHVVFLAVKKNHTG